MCEVITRLWLVWIVWEPAYCPHHTPPVIVIADVNWSCRVSTSHLLASQDPNTRLYLLSDVLSEIIFLSNKTSIVHVMFSELSKERCKIWNLCFDSFLIFSTFWCPFRLGQRHTLGGGLNSVLRDCGHNYHDRPLHRVINKAVMMYFDPSTADILAGAHSIEFPAYHYYVATSPPARPMRTSRLRSSQPGRPGPCRRCAGLVLVGTW